MSGIAGIIRFDGQEVHPADVAIVSQLLRHRGTLSVQRTQQGVLLAFGSPPEASPDDTLVAVTDANLYASNSPDQPFTNYFSQQGDQAFNSINADFAVALWDVNSQTLTCARDPMGVKPLYYVYEPHRFIAFASEIKALVGLREVALKPNYPKFREYLTWTTDYVPYSTETFYETVYSVLPGHTIRADARQVISAPYWQPDLNRFTTLSQPNEYAALFRRYFTEAIGQRMTGHKQAGAHLSGGLDSSSVSCLAQAQLVQEHRPALHTFSIDTQHPFADERAYVQTVVDQWHPIHHTVRPLPNVLDAILEINQLFDRPEQFIIPSSFHLSVSSLAQQLGCTILFTGHDGDGVIPTGYEFLDELLAATNWQQLTQAAQQVFAAKMVLSARNPIMDELPNENKYEAYALSMAASMLKKRFKTEPITHFLPAVWQQAWVLNLPFGTLSRYLAQKIRQKLAQKTLLQTTFQTDFDRQYPAHTPASTAELTKRLTAETQAPVNHILHTTNVICNEQMNHMGAYYGHTYSFPFFDKNVLELGLATPQKIHFNQGMGRGLIRNGLQDILPPAILGRLSKASFVAYGTESAQQLYRATQDVMGSRHHPIWDILDPKAFSDIVAIVFNSQFPARKKTRYNWLLSRSIYLALWLDRLQKPALVR